MILSVYIDIHEADRFIHLQISNRTYFMICDVIYD